MNHLPAFCWKFDTDAGNPELKTGLAKTAEEVSGLAIVDWDIDWDEGVIIEAAVATKPKFTVSVCLTCFTSALSLVAGLWSSGLT